jgi:lipid-A-disaccharide synthase-like uncharacterized protein
LSIAMTSERWLIIGFLGQTLFTMRFMVQWAASEKKKDSVVPVAFWWLSLLGGFTLLTYAVHRQDPVIIVGQAMGLFIYVRNIMLIEKARMRAERRRIREIEAGSPAESQAPSLSGPHRLRRAKAQGSESARG